MGNTSPQTHSIGWRDADERVRRTANPIVSARVHVEGMRARGASWQRTVYRATEAR